MKTNTMTMTIKLYFSKASHPEEKDSILFRFIPGTGLYGEIRERVASLPGVYKKRNKHGKLMSAISAQQAESFLGCLAEIRNEYGSSVYFAHRYLVLDSLAANNYLSVEQAERYKAYLSNDLDEIKRSAEARKDTDLALCLAQRYKERDEGNGTRSLYWLIQAGAFNPSHVFFTDPQNLIASVYGLVNAELTELFEQGDSAKWLINGLASCPTFKCMRIDSCCLNQTFVDFMSKTRTLFEARLETSWDSAPITREQTQMVATALSLNESIESLNLYWQPIGDEGLKMIVDALIANPKTKLKELIINHCRITVIGTAYLLAHIKEIPSLLKISTGIKDDDSVQRIEHILEYRRCLALARSIAPPVVSDVGLFSSSLPLPASSSSAAVYPKRSETESCSP